MGPLCNKEILMFIKEILRNEFMQDKNSRGETPFEILQSNTHISAQAKDECSRILKPKEEKGKLENEADKLLAMREKLKKDKEEAEKKRLAEENAAAEAKRKLQLARQRNKELIFKEGKVKRKECKQFLSKSEPILGWLILGGVISAEIVQSPLCLSKSKSVEALTASTNGPVPVASRVEPVKTNKG